MASVGSNINLATQKLGFSMALVQRLFARPLASLTDEEKEERKGVEEMLRVMREGSVQQFQAEEGKTVSKVSVKPPPAIPPALKVGDVQKFLKSTKGFRMTPALKDIRHQTGGDVAYTNVLSGGLQFPIDKEMVMALQDVRLRHDDIIRNQKGVAAASDYMYSGGTVSGLLTRLQKGYNLNGESVPVRPWMSNLTNPDWVRRVAEVIGWEWDYEIEHTLNDLVNPDHLTDVFINSKADYGLPYIDAKKGDVLVNVAGETKLAIEQILLDSNNIYEHLSLGQQHFKTWLATSEGKVFTTCLLKNKSENIKRSELTTKARPYYVYPAGVSFVCSTVWNVYSKGLKVVGDVCDDTINMVGFSWARGGATLLVDWMLDTIRGGNKFAVYGDDQVIVVHTADGNIYVFVPDFTCMDMCLSQWHFNLVAPEVVRYLLTKFDVDEDGDSLDHLGTFGKRVLPFACLMAFGANVLGPSGCNYTKSRGLNSGIPGTTHFDVIAVACIKVETDDLGIFKDVADLADLYTRCKRYSEVCSKHGFTIKDFDKKDYLANAVQLVGSPVIVGISAEDSEGGMELDSHSSQQVIKGPILGMSLRKVDKDQYVPVPDEQVIFNSLIYRRDTKRGFEAVAMRLVRMAGLMISGGWYFEHLYEACAMEWNKQLEQGVIIGSDDFQPEMVGMEDEMENIQQLFVDKDGKMRAFPTREDICELYIASGQSVEFKRDAESFTGPEVNVAESKGVDSSTPSVIDISGMNWSDVTDEEERILEKQKAQGLVSIPEEKGEKPISINALPLGVPTQKPGDLEEDEAKRKIKNLKHQQMVKENKLKRETAKAQSKSKMQDVKGKGGKKKGIHRDEEQDDEKTRRKSTTIIGKGGKKIHLTETESEEHGKMVSGETALVKRIRLLNIEVQKLEKAMESANPEEMKVLLRRYGIESGKLDALQTLKTTL